MLYEDYSTFGKQYIETLPPWLVPVSLKVNDEMIWRRCTNDDDSMIHELDTPIVD